LTDIAAHAGPGGLCGSYRFVDVGFGCGGRPANDFLGCRIYRIVPLLANAFDQRSANQHSFSFHARQHSASPGPFVLYSEKSPARIAREAIGTCSPNRRDLTVQTFLRNVSLAK
jgi:hypothetical protein